MSKAAAAMEKQAKEKRETELWGKYLDLMAMDTSCFDEKHTQKNATRMR